MFSISKISTLTAILALLFTVGLSAQTYSLDAGASSMKWLGEKVTGQHRGTINLKDGSLTVADGKISGSFAVDMTSIQNLDLESDEYRNKLIGHLKSDDFFSVAAHPTASFEITKVLPYKARQDEKANHKVTGNLTIKGITKQISFPANIEISAEKLAAQASFSIDRSRWEIRYGSGSFFENLGDKLIYDDIHLTLNIVAKADKMSSER